METPARLQVVDMPHLREMTEQDEEAMRRLVAIFLKETASELKALQAAFERRDIDEVHRIAHGCKGASAAYGMTLLAEILKDIESQAHEKRTDKTLESIRQARAAFKDVEVFWKSYLEGTSDKRAA
jgi:HPt (histidine-containing phosphotransfer) domain-containing protein